MSSRRAPWKPSNNIVLANRIRRRTAATQKVKGVLVLSEFTFCAPCLFGLEGPVGDECRRLGFENVRVEDRRVFFDGDVHTLAKANLCLRMAERVMILLGSFEARSFEELYQGVKRLPLEKFIPKDGAFPVKGHSLNSQLHSVPDCQAITKKAAVDRLAAKYGVTWFAETGAVFQLRFSIMKDKVELFLDTTGAALNKRGYRAVAGEAPLHETMAAAMVNLSRYRGREVFFDPFCGSGTILIEAALIAKNRAPGLNRRFASESWQTIPSEVWQQERNAAIEREFHGEYRLIGSDIDPEMLTLAASNAKKAGVADLIEFRLADAAQTVFPAERGILVCNPPYGERMGEVAEAQKLYRAIGRRWKPATGWSKLIISSDPEFEYFFGAKAQKKRKLYNGRLQCYIYEYFAEREARGK